MALLAGNAVVVKAPRSSPLGVMFLFREIVAPVLEEHRAPPGTLNLISGPTREILAQWLESPLANDLLFFGDSSTGQEIGREWMNRGKKPILELSGNDGLVVWKDADIRLAVDSMLETFLGSGQICMVPKFCIVHPAVADVVIRELLARIHTVRPGSPEDSSTWLSPVLKVDKFFEVLAEATSIGALTLTGGRRVTKEGRPALTGPFLEPTIMRIDGLHRASRARCVTEETFFPLMPLVVPDNGPDDQTFQEVAEFLNRNTYGLRNSLWTRNESFIEQFIARVSNGGLLKVNDSHIGFLPLLATHGGTGQSGGPFGELNYVALRTSHLQGVGVHRTETAARARHVVDRRSYRKREGVKNA